VTQVLIIDDHPVVLQGCRQLLIEAGVKEIIEARTVSEGFRLYRTRKPDIVIVDLAMHTGALHGLSFIRRVRTFDKVTPLLVFTMHSDTVVISHAIELGATGYLLKDAPPEEVVNALQRMRDGKNYLSHKLASDVAFENAKRERSPLRNLTLRELETMALIAEGKPYGVIAQQLNLSYKTVANTCTKLKAKLGAHTLNELMRLAIEYLPSIKVIQRPLKEVPASRTSRRG